VLIPRVVVGVAVLAIQLSAPCAASAVTVATCEPFGTVSVREGRYIVQQNEWNATSRQCIRVSGTAWTITRASFELPTDGPPATYPSIYRGCHWGLCTTRDPLPIQVDDLRSATSSWDTRLVTHGAYNVAYDLWTSTTAAPSGQPDGSEIMIWLSSRGGVRPAGSIVGRASIDGVTWDVWTAQMSGWNYVAYQRRDRTRSVVDLDLKAFVDESVRRGITASSWYLIAAEAGFEIWRGGQGLRTNSFSFRASGA
jgi:hypothetical protein